MTLAQQEYLVPPTLEQDLAELLRASKLEGRQARAVAARLGWDGEGASTLAAAAAAEGYSRERVRQLEERLRARARRSRARFAAFAATESALRLIEEAAPMTSREAAMRLAAAGMSRRPFEVAGLLSAAKILGIGHCLEEQDGLILRAGQAELGTRAMLLSRRLVRRSGAVSVDALTLQLGGGATVKEVRRLLELRGEVTWLGDSHTWFLVTGAKTRAIRTLRKMLSVSPSLTIADVDDGLRRALHPVALPRDVVRALCASQSWLIVDRTEDTVTATMPLDQARTLSPEERKLVAMFNQAGPTLRFSHAVQLAERNDLAPNSVRFYLARTPLLQTLARGHYSLVGQAA